MPAVSAKTQESEIVRLVLASFQQELRGPRHGWLTRLLFRPPSRPAIGYAQQFLQGDELGRMSGSAVSVWRLVPEVIEHMPSSFVVPEPDMTVPRACRHFEFAYFAFTLPDDSGSGCIASQFGPLWGHGGRYHIQLDDGVPQLREEGGWIS
jgi:hypothetical protein